VSSKSAYCVRDLHTGEHPCWQEWSGMEKNNGW